MQGFIFFILGFLVCGLIFIVGIVLYHDRHVIGAIRIDQSDPDDRPYLFLNLSVSPEKLLGMKQVICDVDVRDFIPQK